jgi:hypothetical protein
MFLVQTIEKTMSPGHEGNDGGGPDVELHGAPEDRVEEGAHDCREEAGLRGQASQPSICYSLHDDTEHFHKYLYFVIFGGPFNT